MNPTRRLALALTILSFSLLLALPAAAQVIYEEYDEGTVSFHYLQWPFGGLEGDFLADGPVWNPDLTFPEGQDNGCGGGIAGAVGDTTRAIAIGAIQNENGTQDAVAVFVTFPFGPAVGSYPVNLETYSAGFAWLHEATNLTIPEEGDDYQAWFDGIEATYRFGSASGFVHVTEVSEDGFVGTFTGQLGDLDSFTILDVSDASFAVANVAVASVPSASAVNRLSASPNPFNPQTTVKLSLDHPSRLNLSIYDVAGRRVAVLFSGNVDSGTHQWIWNGMNDAGVKQSGGVYFCRAQGADWSESTKLILVP